MPERNYNLDMYATKLQTASMDAHVIPLLCLLLMLASHPAFVAAQDADTGRRRSRRFSINEDFLRNPFAPSVLLPDDLLDAVLALRNSTARGSMVAVRASEKAKKQAPGQKAPRPNGNSNPGSDEKESDDADSDESEPEDADSEDNAPLTSATCDSHEATPECCEKWYIEDTLQHDECRADADREVGMEYHSDEFNVVEEDEVSECLYRDRRALWACCRWLTDARDDDDVQRCVDIRKNIMEHGVRVCMIRDDKERSACCHAIFKGRSFLYERCVKNVPTYINRLAPCVFRFRPDQELCCQQIFPTVGFDSVNRAYTVCADAVDRKLQEGQFGYVEDEAEREESCSHEKLYGKEPFDACKTQEIPPCRINNFMKRTECCHTKFKDKTVKRNRCMIKSFKTCQLRAWKDRLACCASLYRVGSLEVKKCLYQYVHSFIAYKENARVKKCGLYYPPGSQPFRSCVYYPIKYCQITSPNRTTRVSCCESYFGQATLGYQVCKGGGSFNALLDTYYTYHWDWEQMSDENATPQDRVTYCGTKFLGPTYRWNLFACLAEITFDKTRGNLYHFTLFSDTTVLGDVQFTCAIYDELERESCCSINFPPAGTSFETCMSWRPTLDQAYYSTLTNGEERRLQTQLTDSTETQTGVPEVASATQVQIRHRVKAFLQDMKWVEMKLTQDREKSNAESNSDSISAPLMDAYKRFSGLFYNAMRANQTATFYHLACKAWMTCTAVRAVSARSDRGVAYCARLDAVGGGEAIPDRKPIFGWEGGAIEKIVMSSNNSPGDRSTSARKLAVSREILPKSAQAVAINLEPAAEPEAVGVDLLGIARACEVTNLRYTCNALCCDSYFAYSWICHEEEMSCMG